MSRIVPFIWVASLLLLPHSAFAAVYKVVDEHGNVTYTDTPPDRSRAEPVQLPSINTQQPVQARPRPAPEAAASPEEESAPYRRAFIRAPEDDFTLPMGQPSLRVEVGLEPALQEGHWVQLLIDGAAAGSPAPSTTQELLHPERGTHFLSAQVLDERGRVLGETDPVTVHVQRPIVRDPTDPAPRPPSAPQPLRAPN